MMAKGAIFRRLSQSIARIERVIQKCMMAKDAIFPRLSQPSPRIERVI